MPGHLLLRDAGPGRVHLRLRPHLPDQLRGGGRAGGGGAGRLLRAGVGRARQPGGDERHGHRAGALAAQGRALRVRAVRRRHRGGGARAGGAGEFSNCHCGFSIQTFWL